MTFVAHLRALWARRETVRYLAGSQLRSGHRDKVLGHLWNLLDPILFMLVYYIVFGILFGQSDRARPADFMMYVFIGVLSWRFFSTAVGQATGCIRANRALLNELYFPKSVFPVSITLARLYDFAWGCVVVIFFASFMTDGLGLPLAWLPLIAFVQLLFTLGAAFLVAYLGAYFADTANLVDAGLRLWFYCSPVLYYVRGERSLIDEGTTTHFLYMLNPMACLFEAYRDAVLYARMPNLGYLAYAAGVSLVLLLLGFLLFTSADAKYAKHV